ncbi:MAG: ABC transporter permease [Candidatus Saccharimonadales bacterium]
MLGIIIGITSVVTVVSLGEGLKHQMVGHIDRLGSDVITVRTGQLTDDNNGLNLLAFLSPSILTPADVSAIEQLPSVRDVVPIQFVTSSARSENVALNNIFVIGTSSSLDDVLREDLSYGSFFSAGSQYQTSAVIGTDIAHKLFKELNPVGQSVRVLGQEFVVQGVLKPSQGGLLSVAQVNFNSAVFIPSSAATALTGGQTNILQILARSTHTERVDSAVNDIRQVLTINHQEQGEFTVLKQEELLGVASNMVDDITRFVSGIAAISLLVGGIGIMDIMLVSVSERTREIGIRKAVGATNRQILGQFLTEGLLLAVLGGLIGIICSLLIFASLRLYTDLYPVLTVPIMAAAVGVAVAVGIIFSVAPALKAARKDPIIALRNE